MSAIKKKKERIILLYRFHGKTPVIGSDCFIFPEATIGGNVHLANRIIVYPGAVVRAELGEIHIGEETNVQENVSIHSDEGLPVQIGNRVTIGHGAILHDCTVGDDTMIGMGAIVQNKAVIGKHCLIGAGALVKQGMVVPDGSVVYGVPARYIRPVSSAELEEIKADTALYQSHIDDLLAQNLPQAALMEK